MKRRYGNEEVKNPDAQPGRQKHKPLRFYPHKVVAIFLVLTAVGIAFGAWLIFEFTPLRETPSWFQRITVFVLAAAFVPRIFYMHLTPLLVCRRIAAKEVELILNPHGFVATVLRNRRNKVEVALAFHNQFLAAAEVILSTCGHVDAVYAVTWLARPRAHELLRNRGFKVAPTTITMFNRLFMWVLTVTAYASIKEGAKVLKVPFYKVSVDRRLHGRQSCKQKRSCSEISFRLTKTGNPS